MLDGSYCGFAGVWCGEAEGVLRRNSVVVVCAVLGVRQKLLGKKKMEIKWRWWSWILRVEGENKEKKLPFSLYFLFSFSFTVERVAVLCERKSGPFRKKRNDPSFLFLLFPFYCFYPFLLVIEHKSICEWPMEMYACSFF